MSFTPAELLMIASNCSPMKPSRMPQASVSSPCEDTCDLFRGSSAAWTPENRVQGVQSVCEPANSFPACWRKHL